MPFLLRDSTLTGHRQELFSSPAGGGPSGSVQSVNAAPTTTPAVFVASDADTYNATSAVTRHPAGVAAGDLLILWMIRSANDTAPVTPSGWTPQGTPTVASSLTVAVFTRYYQAGDTPPTSQWAATGRAVWAIDAYRGGDSTTPLDGISIVGYLTAAASSSHTVPSLTATVDDTLAVESVVNKSATLETNIAPPAGVTRTTQFYNASASSPNIATGRADTDTDTGATGGGHTWTSTVSSQRILTTLLLRPGTATAPPIGTPGTVNHLWPGALTSTGAKVVAKTTAATSVRLAISTNSGMTSPTYVTAQTPNGAGRTTHTATGLTPNTRYWYQLADTPTGGSESLIGPVGSFVTLQTAGTPVATRKITFGGCVRTGGANPGALTDALAWGPDYGVFNGDITYGGTASTVQANHEAVYDNQLSAVAALRSFVAAGGAASPMASDHDTSNVDNADSNDATGAAALAARKQVMPFTGVYTASTDHTWDDGRVSFYALDIRTTDRSTGASTDTTGKTMLGAAQLARVQSWLSTNPAPFKVIISDTAWMGAADLINKTDWWPAYTTERTTLIGYINTAQSAGTHVELWHGDSHLIGYATAAKNTWGGFPVLCSAGFDQDGGGRNTSTFTAFWNNSSGAVQQYGRVTFTDDGTTITRVFSGWDAAGSTERVAHTQTVTSSQTATLGRPTTTATPRAVTAAPGTGIGTLGRPTVFATARGWTTGANSTATLARVMTASVARPWTAAPGAITSAMARATATTTARPVTAAAIVTAVLGRPTATSTARPWTVVAGSVVRSVDRVVLVGTARPLATLGGTVATLTRVVATSTARPWTGAASVTRAMVQATTVAAPRPFAVVAVAARTLGRPTTTSTGRALTALAGGTTGTVGRATVAATARGIASLGGQIATLARPTTTSSARPWTPAPGTTTRALARTTATSTPRALTASSSSTATLARVLLTLTARAWARTTGGTTRTLARPTAPATARPLYGGGGRPYGATLTPTTGNAQLVPSTTGGHLEAAP